MSPLYAKFIEYLKPGDIVCDLGCGSGRDSKFFMSKGYTVVPIDGSFEMASLASSYLGKPVHCIKFNELNFHDEFDAIWACSSLLHVPKDELIGIFGKVVMTAKNNAIIYTSFKEGYTERKTEDGRIFSDFISDKLIQFISEFSSLHLVELWASQDVRPSKKSIKWLNVFLRVIKNDC